MDKKLTKSELMFIFGILWREYEKFYKEVTEIGPISEVNDYLKIIMNKVVKQSVESEKE